MRGRRPAGGPCFEAGGEDSSRWHYSVATDVLGAVVERASGQPFDVFLRERLFRPLDMYDTFFNVPEDKLPRLLPKFPAREIPCSGTATDWCSSAPPAPLRVGEGLRATPPPSVRMGARQICGEMSRIARLTG